MLDEKRAKNGGKPRWEKDQHSKFMAPLRLILSHF
jgi:hypothetical protein